jgi:hexokinase
MPSHDHIDAFSPLVHDIAQQFQFDSEDVRKVTRRFLRQMSKLTAWETNIIA